MIGSKASIWSCGASLSSGGCGLQCQMPMNLSLSTFRVSGGCPVKALGPVALGGLHNSRSAVHLCAQPLWALPASLTHARQAST